MSLFNFFKKKNELTDEIIFDIITEEEPKFAAFSSKSSYGG